MVNSLCRAHDRRKSGGRLEIDRTADRVTWGLFAPGSAVGAEREDLHVEVEAADRAAVEQFKRQGARARIGTVHGAGLEVFVGDTRSRNEAAAAERLSAFELERRVFGPRSPK